MAENILIVAAHPDDEVLGCGGTIARHTDQGDNVCVVFLADGVGSRNQGKRYNEAVEIRNKAACKAASILGMTHPHFFGFPDNQLDTIPLLELTKSIEKIINKLQPSTIYTNYGGDLNIDHCITNRAVITACRPQPGLSVKKIFSFEVLSSTEWTTASIGLEFTGNMSVDISRFLDRKMAALQVYDMEMRSFPHSRSYKGVKTLAAYRGMSVGYMAAETFLIERILW